MSKIDHSKGVYLTFTHQSRMKSKAAIRKALVYKKVILPPLLLKIICICCSIRRGLDKQEVSKIYPSFGSAAKVW